METYLNRSLSPEQRAEDLYARLTLKEKAGQVHQQLYGFRTVTRQGENLRLAKDFLSETERLGALGFLYGLFRADPWSGRTHENGLTGKLAVRAYNLVQRYTIEHSRFRIPIAVTAEYSHGHQALDSYMLPVNLAVGCTFDPALLRRAAALCARQERSLGIRLSNASLLDILRDPRWGRSEECFGEDPFLASRMAESLILGMAEEGVSVVAKHFCAQGETTGGKNASPARIGERELHEIHLPAAEAAVRAGAAGFMVAYNEIDGIPCHCSEHLLNGILREEMGFRGFVMADGCAVDRLDGMTGDNVKSAALAMNAGVDTGLWDTAFTHIEEAVQLGYVSEKRLDDAVKRVLAFKFASGLFDDPFLEEESLPSLFTVNEAPESLLLARESVVLLKNEGETLPLCPEKSLRIALIGPRADDLYAQMGDYTPPMLRENCSTLLDGFRLCLPDQELLFCDGSDLGQARKLSSEADTVILALGGSSSRFTQVVFDVNGEAREQADTMDCGEGVDLSRLRLPEDQHALFETVRGAARRLVTVIVGGRPYAVPDIAEKTDALVFSFYPGPYGGQAVMEVLTGKNPPSGRLSVSVPFSAAELPSFYNSKRSDRVRTYADARAHTGALYSFGEGMGYSEPEYRNISFRTDPSGRSDTAAEVSFIVHNPSVSSSAAVPMLFITGLESDVTRRVLELKAFRHLTLSPGETVPVVFRLTADDLSVWNRRMKRELQPGKVLFTLKDGFRVLGEETLRIPG